MRRLYCLGLLFLLSTCTFSPEERPVETLLKLNKEQALSIVRLERITEGIFEKEIVGSGKLKARNKADISFPFEEQILQVLVHNGQRVRKGMLLAQLDTFKLEIALRKAEENKKNAIIEVKDQLLTLGYDLQDSVNIPAEKWEMARQIKGYNSITLDIQSIKHQLRQSGIRAPFSGVIADLGAKAHNKSSRYEKLCTLIDDRSLEVEFQILESEYSIVKEGQVVEIKAFYESGKSYRGRIKQINPTVNENGMLKVWAAIRNVSSNLLEGMNVKVSIKKAIPRKIVIPKEAVVNRQNRAVVFTYEEGLAKWNYVELGAENSRFVVVESGLSEGQDIIISGNLDLTHDVVVVADTTMVTTN